MKKLVLLILLIVGSLTVWHYFKSSKNEEITFEIPKYEKELRHISGKKNLTTTKTPIPTSTLTPVPTSTPVPVPRFTTSNHITSLNGERGEVILLDTKIEVHDGVIVEVRDAAGVREFSLNESSLTIPYVRGNEFYWKARFTDFPDSWTSEQRVEFTYLNQLEITNRVLDRMMIYPEKGSRTIELKWKTFPGEKFEVNILDRNYVPIDSKVVTGGEFSYHVTKRGRYYYSIKSLLNPELSLGPIVFRIHEFATHDVFPKEGQRYRFHNKSRLIKFFWKQIDVKDKRWKFQLGLDRKLKKVIVEKNIRSSNDLQLYIDKPGRYYWRLQYIGSDFYVRSMKVQKFTAFPKFRLTRPRLKRRQLIPLVTHKGSDAHLIRLPKLKGASELLLEVYSSKKDARPIWTTRVNSGLAYWDYLGSGKYYARVTAIDFWGRQSKKSNWGELVFPISPLLKE